MPRDLLATRQPRDLLAGKIPATKGSVAKQFGLGLGVDLPVSTLGLPGDIGSGPKPDYSTSPFPGISRALDSGPALMQKGLSYLPTSDQIMGGLERVTGKIPEPQNTEERIARAVGPFASMLITKKPPAPKKVPTIAERKLEQKEAYKRAEDSGFSIPDEDYRKLVEDIGQTVDARGARDFLTPETAKILKRMDTAEVGPKEYRELQAYRKWAAEQAVKKSDSGELTHDAVTSGIIRDKLDNVLSAVADHREGNRLTKIIKNSRKLQIAINQAKNAEDAKHTQAGLATALQQKFKSIADRAEKTDWRGWSPAEREAIQAVVSPGKKHAVLRGLGATSPGKGGLANMFNIALTTAYPFIGIPWMAGSLLSKQLAARKVKNLANRAVETSRSGGGGLLASPHSRLQRAAPAGLISGYTATGPNR